MASIHFLVLSDRNPSNIYVRVRDSRSDVKVKTKLLVNPDHWSHAKKQPKNLKDASMKVLNSKLNSLVSQISSAISNADEESLISKEWLEGVLNKRDVKLTPDYLAEYFDIYYENKIAANAKVAYLKKVKSIKNLLLKYQKAKRKRIQVRHVDNLFAADFVAFMNKNEYNQSYTFRALKFIKTVCKDAQSVGVQVSSNLDQAKTHNEKTYKIYLNLQELEIIKNAKMPSESLSNARDWLIISCYLGQRVSDLLRCEKSRIKQVGSNKLIDLTQKKTELPIMVAIFPQVDEILRKRDGEFPRKISAQRYNEYIKEVCRIAGINELTKGKLHEAKKNRGIDGEYPKWKLITSHVGRRSFATNFYGKYNLPLLMAQTGHSTERSFLDYIGKGRIDRVEELLNLVSNE